MEGLHSYQAHTTAHELGFVMSIGCYSETTLKLTKAALLERYLQACQLRTKWGLIDKDAVIRAVQNQLAQEGQI